MSELFVPLTKIIGGYTDNFVSHRQFYLADCEAIVGPAAVVPNFGRGQHDYLQIKPRAKWKDDFITWLEEPIEEELLDSSDEDEEGGKERQNFESDINSTSSEDTEEFDDGP